MVRHIIPSERKALIKCPRCGALLEYGPADIRWEAEKRFLGILPTQPAYHFITCPCCSKQIPLSND